MGISAAYQWSSSNMITQAYLGRIRTTNRFDHTLNETTRKPKTNENEGTCQAFSRICVHQLLFAFTP